MFKYSKRAPHYSENCFPIIYDSFIVNIAHIKDIGTKKIAQKEQNKEIKNPNISPFVLKSKEYKLYNEYTMNSSKHSIVNDIKVLKNKSFISQFKYFFFNNLSPVIRITVFKITTRIT